MSRKPPVVPRCLFVAKFVSRAKKSPTDLDLVITLEGSQPKAINFSVDIDSGGECIATCSLVQDGIPQHFCYTKKLNNITSLSDLMGCSSCIPNCTGE